MDSKKALVNVIREVTISGKSYGEYVEAVAEKILSQRIVVVPEGVASVTLTWIDEGAKDNDDKNN